MANNQQLKDSIRAVIKQNGNEEITGNLLQQSLIAMIDALGMGYQFMGEAKPETNPAPTDARVMYIAVDSGVYSNFVTPPIELDGSKIAIFLYSSAWSAILLNVPNNQYIANELNGKVDKVEGKGLSTNDLTDELVAKINAAIPNTDIVQELGDGTTKIISQKAITDILLDYARVSGTYPEFVSGGALTLVGKKPGTATYLLRETGGKGAEVASGQAIVKKIEGNAVAFNQLFSKGGGYNAGGIELTFDAANGVYTLNGTATSDISIYLTSASGAIASELPMSHYGLVEKIYLGGVFEGSASSNIHTSGYDADYFYFATSESKKKISFWATANRYPIIAIKEGDTFTNYKFRLLCFDLTLSGIDNLTTVAQIEAWLANNPGLHPFYAATSGELLGAKVVGFKPMQTPNLLNPTNKKARLVTYDYADGSNQYTVKRLPAGATLKFTPDATGIEETITPSSDHFTISGNGTLEVVTADSVADVWLIMTWDGSKDDIENFVPYNAPTVEFDTSKIYRDDNGTKVQEFPAGMLKADYAGTVRDALYFDKTTKKWVSNIKAQQVDLGTLNYTKDGTNHRFYATINNMYSSSGWGTNIICQKYPCFVWDSLKDKFVSQFSQRIYIKDTAYDETSSADFKAAMNGVMLNYELTTPVFHTDLYYKTGDNTYVPMEEIFPDDVVLIVNNWATEENLIAEPVNNAPQAVAPQVTTQYSMDVIEWIDSANNGTFINDESMDNALTALASAAGLTYDDSAKTWDNGHWDYSNCFSQIEPNE